MTSGFGVDRSTDGTTGTSSADIRKIFGGLYSPGVINGCAVTTSSSLMRYTVAAGVVAISTSSGEIVLAPVATGNVTAPAAPGTGTRTDIVYVQQRYPSIEGDATVVLGVATVLPARAVAVGQFIVSAGQTNTNAAVRTGGVNYSIPYGATLGRLHYYQHTLTGIGGSLPAFQRYGNGTFTLPTDRRLRFKVHAVVGAQSATGFDNSKYCEYGFIPSVNNSDFVLWSTGGLHQAWQTHYFETTLDVPAGQTTVSLIFTKLVGPGTPVGYYGTGGDGYGRRGIEFTVEDVGPVV